MVTPEQISFSDNIWHDVTIQRHDSNITMRIDNHLLTKTFPQNSVKFHVHFGIFLGGVGEFSETYLNKINNYRGCLSDVS